MAKREQPFPKNIFVKREQDNSEEDSYLVADETADSFEDRERVAIYELQAVKTKRVTHALE